MSPVERSSLIAWYAANRRDLPWRQTREPYAVWVSEIMLQQTQVATALPYFERWMRRFPTVAALAEADEQEALSLWQGLGYYRRCRMLLAGARWVHAHGFPLSREDWLRVPGVGPYTAAAIASICLNQAVGVVDGNVERVFARFACCERSGAALERAAWDWAQEQVDRENPGNWNQAVMELGATICRPRRPKCRLCPIRSGCRALAAGMQAELPVSKPSDKAIPVSATAIVAQSGALFGLEQIPDGEWGERMWRFPQSGDFPAVQPVGTIRHTVTRHRVELAVFSAHLARRNSQLRWVSLSELDALPMPSPQRKALRLVLETNA